MLVRHHRRLADSHGAIVRVKESDAVVIGATGGVLVEGREAVVSFPVADFSGVPVTLEEIVIIRNILEEDAIVLPVRGERILPVVASACVSSRYPLGASNLYFVDCWLTHQWRHWPVASSPVQHSTVTVGALEHVPLDNVSVAALLESAEQPAPVYRTQETRWRDRSY